MKIRKFRDSSLQEFWQKVNDYSQKELKSWNTYDSGFSYYGQINDDQDEPIWVLWHAVNLSYSPLEMRALEEHYKNVFSNTKGLVWLREWANGNGGSEWLVINLSESTTAALREIYEQFSEIWHCRDTQDYYYAHDTREYEDMYEEESSRDFKIWWEDQLRRTPFSDLSEDYYAHHDDLNYKTDDCWIWSQSKQNHKEKFLMQQILQALNAGDLELDQEDYEEFMRSDAAKPWPWIWQATDGKFYFESELTWSDNQWLPPFKTNTRKMFEDD